MLSGLVGLTAIVVSLCGAMFPTDSSQSVLTLRPSLPGPWVGPQIFPDACLMPPSDPGPAPGSTAGASTTLKRCSGTARGSDPSSPASAVVARPAAASAAAKPTGTNAASGRLGDVHTDR